MLYMLTYNEFYVFKHLKLIYNVIETDRLNPYK